MYHSENADVKIVKLKDLDHYNSFKFNGTYLIIDEDANGDYKFINKVVDVVGTKNLCRQDFYYTTTDKDKYKEHRLYRDGKWTGMNSSWLKKDISEVKNDEYYPYDIQFVIDKIIERNNAIRYDDTPLRTLIDSHPDNSEFDNKLRMDVRRYDEGLFPSSENGPLSKITFKNSVIARKKLGFLYNSRIYHKNPQPNVAEIIPLITIDGNDNVHLLRIDNTIQYNPIIKSEGPIEYRGSHVNSGVSPFQSLRYTMGGTPGVFPAKESIRDLFLTRKDLTWKTVVDRDFNAGVYNPNFQVPGMSPNPIIPEETIQSFEIYASQRAMADHAGRHHDAVIWYATNGPAHRIVCESCDRGKGDYQNLNVTVKTSSTRTENRVAYNRFLDKSCTVYNSMYTGSSDRRLTIANNGATHINPGHIAITITGELTNTETYASSGSFGDIEYKNSRKAGNNNGTLVRYTKVDWR